MALWKIFVYQERNDKEPIREGYLSASTEEEAESIAVDAMGTANRADLDVKARTVWSLPTGKVLWA